MAEIRITVIGKPQPAGSKSAFAIRTKDGTPTGQVNVRDANKKAPGWMKLVKATGARVVGDPYNLLDGPVNVSMTFYVARPKGHYGTGRNAHRLKDSAPPFPTSKPDSLKLARGTEDALTGVVWRDDAQVVDLDVHKRYVVPALDPRERAEIVVRYAPEGAR